MYVYKYTYIIYPGQTDLINDGKDHDGAHLGSDRLRHPRKCLNQGSYRAAPACMCGTPTDHMSAQEMWIFLHEAIYVKSPMLLPFDIFT